MGEDTEEQVIDDGPDFFHSGWRPTIGWIATLGLAYAFIGYPTLLWSAALFKWNVTPPPLSTDGIMALATASIGMGAMRSYEKHKGIAK